MIPEARPPRLRELVRDGDAYRFMLAEADLGVLVIGDAIEDCNEAACRLFGRAREALVGRDALELSPETQPDGSGSAVAATRRLESALAGLPQWFEWQFIGAGGDRLDTIVHVEAVLVDGRRRVLLRLRDVSRLQRAESRLRDTERRLQQILDNSTNALVYAKDAAGRYLFVNRAFERLLGMAADEIVGRTPADLFASDLAERLMRNDRRAIAERRAIEVEEQIDVGGELRTEISNKFPLLDGDGKPYGVCGISVDITARTRVEQAMRRAALAVSAAEGEGLFADLVRSLAEILAVDIAFIALPLPGDAARLRMLAFYVDGRMVEDFEYALAGTPCEQVLGQEYHFFPSALAERFPLDEDFRRLRVDAYAGYPLTGAHGRSIGLISVVSRRPLADPGLVEAMLKIFAARAVTEIERRRADEALRASEEQYRAIFNASDDALILWDSQVRRVDVNPAYERMFGWKREEVIGRGYEHPRFTPEYAHQRVDLVRRALAGESCRAELEPMRKDGERFHTEVRAIPFQHQGEPHVLAIIRDITERKRADEALRDSEAQYRAIFNASVDGLVLKDAEQRIVDVNEAFLRMHGYRREQLVGQRMAEFIPADLQARCEVLLPRLIAGEPCHFQARTRRRDGTLFDVEIEGVPMQYRGQPHALVVMRDITEAKRAEDRLRASEAQYRAIFNASADALMLWNSRLQRVDVNPAHEKIFGFARDEVVGRGFEGLPYPEEFVRPRIEMVRRALAGDPSRAELVALRKDGTRIVTELRAIPFQHQGEPHVLQIARDVTERQRAEEERSKLEAQLRQAQKMEAIGHLTGGIAHDFNNILTSILGYVVLARERDAAEADAKLAQYLDQAQRASLRGRDLIQQMLTFSRGQRGEPRRLDLTSLAQDALKLIEATLPSSIVLDVDIERQVPAVLADPVQVEQVLLNLLINARDATAGSGTIEVRVDVEECARATCASCRKPIAGRFVALAVRDSGSGIRSELLDRIFDPFFTTKGVGKGSGMGLSVVHGIVHDCGGHILVHSAPGAGATFRALFPAISGSRVEAAAETGAPDRATLRAAPLSGRVLVVDDEPMVGEFIGELLASRGLDVTVKSDPVEAARWFAEDPRRVDLVVTDQTMPRMPGLELARRLTFERPELPVVLCTGYGGDIGPDELRQHGVTALIRKPVEPAALTALIASHLAQR